MTDNSKCCGLPLADSGYCVNNPWHKQAAETTDPVIPPEAVEAAAKAYFGEIHEVNRTRILAEFEAVLAAALPHLRPLFEVATQVGLELGRQEALAISWQQLQDAADRWRAQSELWDTGTTEQRGTPRQVMTAWEHAGELRCWAKHLNRADILLDAPEVATRTADARTDPSGHTDLPPTPDALSKRYPEDAL